MLYSLKDNVNNLFLFYRLYGTLNIQQQIPGELINQVRLLYKKYFLNINNFFSYQGTDGNISEK
jgi:hypothetical protein